MEAELGHGRPIAACASRRLSLCVRGCPAVAALVALAPALAACHTPTQPELSLIVAKALQPGMIASSAEVALLRKGFTCFRYTALTDDCTRTGTSAIVTTCLERVTLEYDASAVRLHSWRVNPIACTGL